MCLLSLPLPILQVLVDVKPKVIEAIKDALPAITAIQHLFLSGSRSSSELSRSGLPGIFHITQIIHDNAHAGIKIMRLSLTCNAASSFFVTTIPCLSLYLVIKLMSPLRSFLETLTVYLTSIGIIVTKICCSGLSPT